MATGLLLTVERNLHGRPGLPGQRSQTVLSPCHYHTCTVNIHEEMILKLERFVVIMYCRTSGDMNVNTAWMILFSQMSRNIDNIPPTQAALDQHIKRSSYQSGHVCGLSLEVQPELPDVTDWWIGMGDIPNCRLYSEMDHIAYR